MTYVVLPTPESSSTLGLPIVPAAIMASRSTETVRVLPSCMNSTAEAVIFPPYVSFPQMIRETVAFDRTVKFGLYATGV